MTQGLAPGPSLSSPTECGLGTESLLLRFPAAPWPVLSLLLCAVPLPPPHPLSLTPSHSLAHPTAPGQAGVLPRPTAQDSPHWDRFWVAPPTHPPRHFNPMLVPTAPRSPGPPSIHMGATALLQSLPCSPEHPGQVLSSTPGSLSSGLSLPPPCHSSVVLHSTSG